MSGLHHARIERDSVTKNIYVELVTALKLIVILIHAN